MSEQRGFTLIELLVVIGIILILVAVLMPAIEHGRRKAVAIDCRSRLRSIVFAANGYALEFGGVIPPSSWWWNWHDAKSWHQMLDPYLSHTRGAARYRRRTYVCPAKPLTNRAYGWNHAGLGSNYRRPENIRFYRVADVAKMSRTIAVCDTGRLSNPQQENPLEWDELPGSVGSFMIRYRRKGHELSSWKNGWRNYFTGALSWPRTVPRHDGLVQCGMLDGHVQALRAEKIYNFAEGEPACLWDRK